MQLKDHEVAVLARLGHGGHLTKEGALTSPKHLETMTIATSVIEQLLAKGVLRETETEYVLTLDGASLGDQLQTLYVLRDHFSPPVQH